MSCIKRLALGFLFILQLLAIYAQAERPNILWIVSEDNSAQFLRLYHPDGVSMPYVEGLAHKGIVFNHAFSNGPVCSVARSTLISGCYAPRIGAQYHRRHQKVPMPEGLHMFPHYLREAGYYTSNNSKEDYNIFKGADVWDESSRQASYRNRNSGQPFFHVQNFHTTHEGQLHFTAAEMDSLPLGKEPDQVAPFPYHPQTDLSRFSVARYHALHQKLDRQIGEFLNQLAADSLLDETIIFYYGDHGGILPRSKGYVYESGLHVPLVVYAPEKWQHLLPQAPGSLEDAFVSFMDFGPTVLHLAGLKVPTQMDGRPFLGEGIDPAALAKRDQAFGYADRFDEKYDLVRSYRKGRYKYIRNYQPFNVDGLFNAYRYKMLMYQEWKDLSQQNKLDSIQSQFFASRAPEQLFDLAADPHEVHNLAQDSTYADQLQILRGELNAHLDSLSDLSFLPEPYFLEHAIENPTQFGQRYSIRLRELRAIADLQLLSFPAAKSRIHDALTSSDPLKRYWGLIVCSSFGNRAFSYFNQAQRLSRQDENNLVRARAAEFLGIARVQHPGEPLLACLEKAQSEMEAVLILNSMVLLRDAYGYKFDIHASALNSDWVSSKPPMISQRLSYLSNE